MFFLSIVQASIDAMLWELCYCALSAGVARGARAPGVRAHGPRPRRPDRGARVPADLRAAPGPPAHAVRARPPARRALLSALCSLSHP